MKLTDPNEYQNYEPIGDKVLLVMPKVEPQQLESVGGILVDHAAALKSSPMRETVVVARGPECKQVEKGDTVLWNMNNASPFPFGENNLYFLPESHIVCITKRGECEGIEGRITNMEKISNALSGIKSTPNNQ